MRWGRDCLSACLRSAVSTDGQSAFADGPVACEQTVAVPPTQNGSEHPRGNLAIFTRGNAYARGLLPLGKVDAGFHALQRPGPLQVRIECIED